MKSIDECMKNKKRFYQILNITGLFVCIVGFVLFISQKPLNYWWFVIALIGALMSSFSNKTGYIYPKCGTEFESKDKIILKTGRSGFRRSLAICPKCKKNIFLSFEKCQ